MILPFLNMPHVQQNNPTSQTETWNCCECGNFWHDL